MAKRISYVLLYTLLIFTSSIVIADRRSEPYNVTINDIIVTRGVANRIFDDAKKYHIQIRDAKNQDSEVVEATKGVNVIIESSLMNIIAEAYNDADPGISTGGQIDNIVMQEIRGIVVYIEIKKDKNIRVIRDYIITRRYTEKDF